MFPVWWEPGEGRRRRHERRCRLGKGRLFAQEQRVLRAGDVDVKTKPWCKCGQWPESMAEKGEGDKLGGAAEAKA